MMIYRHKCLFYVSVLPISGNKLKPEIFPRLFHTRTRLFPNHQLCQICSHSVFMFLNTFWKIPWNSPSEKPMTTEKMTSSAPWGRGTSLWPGYRTTGLQAACSSAERHQVEWHNGKLRQSITRWRLKWRLLWEYLLFKLISQHSLYLSTLWTSYVCINDPPKLWFTLDVTWSTMEDLALHSFCFMRAF